MLLFMSCASWLLLRRPLLSDRVMWEMHVEIHRVQIGPKPQCGACDCPMPAPPPMNHSERAPLRSAAHAPMSQLPSLPETRSLSATDGQARVHAHTYTNQAPATSAHHSTGTLQWVFQLSHRGLDHARWRPPALALLSLEIGRHALASWTPVAQPWEGSRATVERTTSCSTHGFAVIAKLVGQSAHDKERRHRT